jgi:hypothetical protein
MGSEQPLSVNGLLMPSDFPTSSFEATYLSAMKLQVGLPEGFVGAWNAVAYRYRALVDYGTSFEVSVREHGAAPAAAVRYAQEKDLFGFFSSAFSTFEAFYYGMFAVGSMLSAGTFPFATDTDRQRVGVGSTIASYRKTWPDSPIVPVFEMMARDPLYKELRDARNILTHRAAPGRTIYASFSEEKNIPTGEWKLLNAVLDEHTTRMRRQGVSRLLASLMSASHSFLQGQEQG